MRYKPSFWDMRVFGSGGFFGYIGFFQGNEIGRYSGFFADTSQAFLIRTKRGKLYVFSTEAPDRTVEELKKRIQLEKGKTFNQSFPFFFYKITYLLRLAAKIIAL